MEPRRSQSIVQDKSFRFAVHIVEYIRRQQKDHVNLVLNRQLTQNSKLRTSQQLRFPWPPQ